MDIYNKQLLVNHYKNIYLQNEESIRNGGVGDEFLIPSAYDTRMSIVLLIRLHDSVSNNINTFVNRVKEVEPDLYYYPKEDFHITVLDILRGTQGRKIPSNIEDYIFCIKKCASQIKPFYINFEGVTASDNATLICGYYEYELEKLRKLLRNSFEEHDLCLEERYQTFSSHVTVARIPNKLRSPSEYIKTIQQANNFGSMKVESLELVYHNWYDSKKQTLATIELF